MFLIEDGEPAYYAKDATAEGTILPFPGWDEVAELLTDSYCVMAPRKLVKLVGAERAARPPD